MTKFKYFSLVVLLAAAVIMLYFCMDLKPEGNYLLQHSEYPVWFNGDRSIHVTANYLTNNVTDNIKVTFPHVIKSTININHITTRSYKNEKTIHAVNDDMHIKNLTNTTIKGIILVTLYGEQQVGAAMSMFSLQKWAKLVGALVVEPFVQKSTFKLPIVSSQKALAAQLRFRDYYDIDIWNNMSISMNGAPLIPWETFIDQAPKKYIFVAIVNDLRKEERPIYIGDEIVEQEYCNSTFDHLTNKYSFYINHLLQTKLVRRVCLSFYKTIMHIDKFTDIIYGNFSSSDVIVWFQVWKGFANHDRVRVLQHYLYRNTKTLAMLHTSKRISDASQRYIREFLKSEPGKYTAISMRTIVRAKYLPRSSHSSFFHNCIKELGGVISSTNIINSTIFVAMDLGRFGDKVVENFIDKNIINNIETEVFQTVYNNSLTMQKWEQSFIQATNGITDSGYIAAMQRTIVENSRCLVLFGGKSNYQQALLLAYKEKQVYKTCIYEVCYEK